MAEQQPVRDERGRLLPGHPPLPGVGRKPKQVEEDVFEFVASLFDEETKAKARTELRAQIQAGKVRTIRELLPYLIPKKTTTELTGAGGEPLFSMSDIVAAIQAAGKSDDGGATGDTG